MKILSPEPDFELKHTRNPIQPDLPPRWVRLPKPSSQPRSAIRNNPLSARRFHLLDIEPYHFLEMFVSCACSFVRVGWRAGGRHAREKPTTKRL